jgi:penicillin-binding protein 2
MFRQDERRPPSGSQFAVRVAVLSGIALVAFAVIFFRLWYLEVLSGEAYLKEANSNRVREIKVQAPRGEILDANGDVLVRNRSALSLQVRPDRLPRNREDRNKELRNLADAADMKIDEIKKEIRKQTLAYPASPVTLKRDVPQDLVLFLRERQDQFPGISAEEVYVRDYPQGTLAAHLLG